jgi:hypothetical protein
MRKTLNLMIATVLGMAFILMELSAQAAIVEVEVTIKSVDAKSRGITVVYETKLGQKSIDLDVSRKAEITVNGKEGTLDSLGRGLNGKVSYDKDLAIVTKIEAKGTPVATKQPELVEVSELNDGGDNEWPSLTEDGLTIYWARNRSMIWTAHRDDSQSLFTDKKQLFPGAMPTISSDGLELVFASQRTDGQKGVSLHVTTRTAADKTFRRPTEIHELRDFIGKDPYLTSDGLTLYFCACRVGTPENQQMPVVSSTRKDKSSPWSAPKRVPNVAADSQAWGPFLTKDGLHLFCEYRIPSNWKRDMSDFVVWSRASATEPFEKPRYYTIDGIPPLIGGSFHHIASTNELFFHRFPVHWQGVRPPIGIWIVKNFTLPEASN